MAETNKDLSSPIPSLPASLIARILTYNVTDVRDVAKLRLVGNAIGQQAIHLLPLLSESCSHWIRCPDRRLGMDDVTGSFVENLCALDWDSYYEFGVRVGDVLEVVRDQISLIESQDDISPSSSSKVILRVVGRPRPLREVNLLSSKRNSTAFQSNNESEYVEQLEMVCASLLNAKTVEQFLADDANEMVFFDPPPNSNASVSVDEYVTTRQEQNVHSRSFFAIPAMITCEIDPTESYIHRTVQANDLKTFYQLNIASINTTVKSEEPEATYRSGSTFPFLQPLFSGGQVWAVDAGPVVHNGLLRLIYMLMYLQAEETSIINNESGAIQSQRLFWLSSLWDKHQQHQLVEGVVVVDDFISTEFRQLLIAQVDALAEQQERDHAVDYHPHSNQVVRDLVHPALYSYIENVTPLIASVQDVDPCIFPGVELPQESGKDLWGRLYETSQFQWLPSYVSISADGKCQFDTYINNLTPRDNSVHSALYKSLEGLLEHALLFIESGLSYVHAVRPLLRNQDEDVEFNDDPLSPLDLKPVSLRGRKLQVITKIVDYELTPQHDTYEGVWHVEGMSHEEIVLTCLYILDRDESIEGGEIEFKRAFLRDEAEHMFSKVPQARPRPLDEMVEEGLVPLGTVETLAGRLVVFPNSHVHRVKEMKLVRRQSTGEKRTAVVAKRRIVVFFVVNPQKRIVSTREVAPQQIHSGGSLPHADALQHRLALMAERKYKKQDWNVRPIELCEH